MKIKDDEINLISKSMGIDDQEIKLRKEFLDIGIEDIGHLREFNNEFVDTSPKFVNQFYKPLMSLKDLIVQQRLQEDLQSSVTRINSIFNNISDAVITIRDKGIIENFKSAAVSIFDYEKGEALGLNIKTRMPQPFCDKRILTISRITEQTAESALITDTRGIICYVSPAFEDMTGYKANKVIGTIPNIVRSDSQGIGFYRKLWG